MNIFKYIINLFKGRDNLIVQLSIFALCGIMAVSFNGIFSIYTGYSIISVFAVPKAFEASVYSILGFLIFIYFIGYSYKFVNGLYNSGNGVVLPSVSLNCFTVFLKILPVMVVWGLYLAILGFAGLCLFNNFLALIVYSLFLFLLLPFINLIFVKFARDFKYTKEVFSPRTLIEIIKKTFKPVFLFLVQFILMSFALTLLISFILKFGINAPSRFSQLIIVLAVFCVSSYLQQVLNLAYYEGLVKIVKEKL